MRTRESEPPRAVSSQNASNNTRAHERRRSARRSDASAEDARWLAHVTANTDRVEPPREGEDAVRRAQCAGRERGHGLCALGAAFAAVPCRARGQRHVKVLLPIAADVTGGSARHLFLLFASVRVGGANRVSPSSCSRVKRTALDAMRGEFSRAARANDESCGTGCRVLCGLFSWGVLRATITTSESRVFHSDSYLRYKI